jgi:hypothetical protein
MGGTKLSDFIVESGHHGENIANLFRHSETHKYTLIQTGMVMEDQSVVRDIMDGDLNPEIFQGKTNKIESCKRLQKKIPAPGIVIFGKDEEGFYSENYSLHHLATVGKEKVKLKDMSWREITLLSDIHVGKGAVKYSCLRTALQKIEDTIDGYKEEGESAPLLIMANESLQGRNYAIMPVETVRSTPRELREKLEAIVPEKTKGKDLESIIAEWKENMIQEAVNEIERTNEPRIMNQLKSYHDLTNAVVLKTLLYNKDDISVVFNEATHIAKTVGEFGITEVELQSFAFEQLDNLINILEKEGIIKNAVPNYYNKIRTFEDGLCGYGKFELRVGQNLYKFSTTHKAGSASPNSNIPLKHVRRAITMGDEADFYFTAHHHIPYAYAIGKAERNNISVFYKGATFNEFDSYGKKQGWSPAVVGYERIFVPTNKHGKGAYKVKFITSETLIK